VSKRSAYAVDHTSDPVETPPPADTICASLFFELSTGDNHPDEHVLDWLMRTVIESAHMCGLRVTCGYDLDGVVGSNREPN
jgi:hypothetical protein